jgi:hypothetical protein
VSDETAQHDYIYAKSPLTGNWYRVTEYEAGLSIEVEN